MSSKRDAMKSRMGSGGPAASVVGFDKSLYGNLDAIDKATQNADPLPIRDIYPDPSQPRKIGPTRLRAQWELNLNISSFINEWMGLAGMNAGELREIVENYTPEDEEKDWQTGNPTADGLIALGQLAGNIRLLGLTYPITVSEKGNRYMVETGERRLWAFWMLKGLYGGSDYDLIPARIVPPSVWRQASENFNRENLNAIGMARQFALLLMDVLSQSEDGPDFLGIEQILQIGGTEQEFYAQVADGQQFKIPKNQGSKILNAMGLKHPDQLRRIRAILRLPSEIWMQADDENWSEGRIREYLQSLNPTPQNPHNFVDSVTIVTVSPQSEPEEKTYDGQPELNQDGYTDDPETLRQMENNIRSFELPGEKRAQATGLYPASTPVKPINRATKVEPLFQIGEWARVKGSGQAVQIMGREWVNNFWDYKLTTGNWFAEYQLMKADDISDEERTVKKVTLPPSPSSAVEVEEDEEEWADKPMKSTELLFDKNTVMYIRDLAKLTEQEIWQWVTTYGYGLDSFMAWHSKVEESLAAALVWAEETAARLDAEYKAGKTE